MQGTLYFAEGRPTLCFQRKLAHAPEKVWRAISDPICPWPEARTAELERHYARLVEPAV